ncbi:MAG: hypothetical protein JRN20_09350, partial [Nitrososphaerota archaeon]|nr:hypothetical protein [Nitrososphaerota archaeon]
MNGRALPLTVVVLLVIGIFFSILPFSSLGAVPRAYATTSTLVQDNKNSQPFTCTHASSCTVSVNFPSNVHSGDVVVVGVIDSVDPIFCGNTTVGYCSPTSSLSISDSLHSSYSVAKTLIDSSSYGSLFIYDATLSSSGADAITVADSTTNANGLWVFIFEVSGVTTSSASTGAGGPTIFSTPSTSTSTSSVTFSPGSFLLAVVLSDGTSASPEGGFTSFAFSSQSSAQNAMYTEYATSGVSSPTIFPASVTAGTLTPAFWDEVGIALQPLPSRNAVNLSTPCIEGLQVDINGDTTSGQNVSKIVFNWGDGTIQSHLFPFEHTYKAPGTYSIIVTAYYKDGSTAFASTKVTVGSVVGMGCFSLVLSSSDGGTVHYVRDGNVSGSVASGKSQTLYIAAGDDLELTAIPSGVGFPFASWAMEGNTTFISGSTTDAYIVIAVGANSTSNASFLEPNSPVACTISSGSTIQVGQSVSCSINQVVTWFVTDFSPSGYTTSSSENFMAVSNGKGAITASWGCTVGASPSLCVETFTYTIDPSTTIASCSVGDGSSIQLDATVTCTFTGDSNGFKFNGWGASDFTPYQSNSPTQTFTSNNEGKGEIRISWLDSSGAINYEGFNYQIGPNTAIASCTPDSGSTVELYTYVTCTFTGSGTFDGWLGSPPPTPTKTTSFTTQTFETTSITTSQVVKPKTAPPLTGQFSPYASGSTTQTFEANATGQAAITIFWSGTS